MQASLISLHSQPSLLMQKNFIPVILIDCVDRLHCSKLVLPFLYPICSNTEATGEKNQSSSCGVQDALFLRECVRNLPCERRMASLSEARTMCQWAVRRVCDSTIAHHPNSCVRWAGHKTPRCHSTPKSALHSRSSVDLTFATFGVRGLWPH